MAIFRTLFLTAAITCICMSLTATAENNCPILYNVPHDIVVARGASYSDTLIAYDADLFIKNLNERLTFEVVSPKFLTVIPEKIQGPLLEKNGDPRKDTILEVVIYTGSANWDVDDTYITDFKIRVEDVYNCSDTITVPVRLWEQPVWSCVLNVENLRGNGKELTFGQGMNATTGDGTYGSETGELDAMYAEYEIPAVNESTVFDARWTIPTRTGTLWNIQPGKYMEMSLFWRGTTLDNTNDTDDDTILFKWDPGQIPAVKDAIENPYQYVWYICDGETGGQEFKVNMKNLDVVVNEGYVVKIETKMTTPIVTLTAYYDADSFVIKNEPAPVGVRQEKGCRCLISPNPVSGNLNLSFPANPKLIEIFNSIGILMYSSSGDTGTVLSLDVTAWPSGSYFVREGTTTTPFIKN